MVLTVTDQNGITASASCPVQVIEGNLPPAANPGGPYNFCVAKPMVLDASGSTDPEGGALSYAWDLGLPLNFSPVDSTAVTFDAASAFATAVPGTYQIALRVTDDHGHATSVFPNITIHAASDPAFCNAPPELFVPANLTTHGDQRGGRGGDVHGDRQRFQRWSADAVMHAGVRLDVRDRHDDGVVHGDGLGQPDDVEVVHGDGGQQSAGVRASCGHHDAGDVGASVRP